MMNTINKTKSTVVGDLARDVLPRYDIIIVNQKVLAQIAKQSAKTK